MAILVVIVALAVWTDIQERRIPNLLTFGGAAVGICLQVVILGPVGLLSGVAGWLIGFAFLAPFYMAGGMGSGDVKLMAMVGSFFGPAHAVLACICVLLAGAVVGPLFVLYMRCVQAVAERIVEPALEMLSRTEYPGPKRDRAAEVPYAVAIAAGTFFFIWQAPLVNSLWASGL